MRKLTIMLLCAMTVVFLGGCAGYFDASAYIQALMDNSYKNDSSLYVSQKLGTAEKAQELYDQGVELQMYPMLGGMDPTQEQEEAYRQVIKEMLAKAKYTVGEAEEKYNGFVVTVTCERMNIFGPAIEDFQNRYIKMDEEWTESGDYPSQEEIMDWSIDTMEECLKDALANVTYDAPEDVTVSVDLVDKVYTPNVSDIANLTKALFDDYQF